MYFGGNRVSGDFAADVYDLFDRVAVAVAKIEPSADPRFEGLNVRLGKIPDVDIVPHAGAIACFIIIAEDDQFFS